MTHPGNKHVRGAFLALTPLLVAVAIAGTSCTEGGVIGSGSRQSGPAAQATTTPAPKATGLGGGVGDETLPTPTPSPARADGGAGPSPTPTAGVTVSQIWIYPASTVEISLPADSAEGGEAGRPTSAQLAATVTMSDGSTASAVTWVSLNPAVATVGATGLVEAAGAGETFIQARSQGDKTAVRKVIVSAAGDVEVTVQ